jgi:hypothetical protein
MLNLEGLKGFTRNKEIHERKLNEASFMKRFKLIEAI